MPNNNFSHFLKKFQSHYFDAKIFFYVIHLSLYNQMKISENLFYLFQKFDLQENYLIRKDLLNSQTFEDIYIVKKAWMHNYQEPKKFFVLELGHYII